MIVHTRVESAHLAGNLLGDPSEETVRFEVARVAAHVLAVGLDVSSRFV